MKNKVFLTWAGALVLVCGIYYIYREFTMNFGMLGFILLFLCLLVPIFYHWRSSNRKYSVSVCDLESAYISAFIVLSFGAGCVFTLDNYFFPQKEVYTNSDHHVLRIDGVNLQNPRKFLLAGNTKNAFFDSDCINGSATVQKITPHGAEINMSRFTRALYFEDYSENGACSELTLVNNLLRFKSGSPLYLKTNAGKEYKFTAEYDAIRDTTDYKLTIPDGTEVTSFNHSFLMRGYALNLLLTGIAVDAEEVDFEGIHIVRPQIYPKVKKSERVEKYADVGYAVEYQPVRRARTRSMIKSISTDGKHWYRLDGSDMADYVVTVPMNQYFSIGYDGSRTPSVCFTDTFKWGNSNGATLCYKMPLMHYFTPGNSRYDNSMLVTTSLNTALGNENRFDALPENIMLFDVFTHSDNINRINPMLVSYVSGPTMQALQFSFYEFNPKSGNKSRLNVQKVLAGERIAGTGAMQNSSLEWIMNVENLKATSIYSPLGIKCRIFLFSIALAVLLIFGSNSISNPRRARMTMFSTVEFSAYMITLYLVTLRWFLLWRVSVFPPVDHLTFYEYTGLFQSKENKLYLDLIMWTMVGVIAAMKIGFLNLYTLKRWKSSVSEWLSRKLVWMVSAIERLARKMPWISPVSEWLSRKLPFLHNWLGGIVLITVNAALLAASIAGRHSGIAWFVISVPVLMYFINTIAIHAVFSPEYSEDVTFKSIPFRHRTTYALLLTLINSLVITIVLMVVDSGYGILFFTFSLFWMLWNLHDHVRFYIKQGYYKPRSTWFVLLLFFVLVALVWWYKEAIKALTSGSMALVVVAIAGVILTVIISDILNVMKSKVRGIPLVPIAALVVGLLFAGVGYGFNKYLQESAQHTAQRIKVHSDLPEEALAGISDDETEKRYMQAAINHMIIGQYNERGTHVALIGEHGAGYFKMQPHSKIGAMWGAQLSDISLVRFVIAEHSQWLPLLLVAFFLIMLVWGARQTKYHRFVRALLIQIPLLLMVQSLLIWMANTKRFIFLGQDFPMISINSRLTLVFYFMLILIWIWAILYEKTSYEEIEYDNDYRHKDQDSHRDAWVLGVVMTLCLFCASHARTLDYDTFNVTKVMKSIDEDLGYKSLEEISNEGDHAKLNELLAEYQKERKLKVTMHTDMSALIADFDTVKRASDCFSTDFGRKMWRNFVERGCKNNSPKAVMHAHLNSRKQLQINVLNYFYNKELPERSDDQWRGNFVAANDTIHRDRREFFIGGLKVWHLPAEWMHDGGEITLVGSNRSRISGGGRNLIMDGNLKSAVVLRDGMSVDHVAGIDSVIPHNTYFARSVLVNGQRIFVYPLGEKFYWIRNFAKEVLSHKSKMKKEQRSETFHADVKLTLSSSMTQATYNILATKGAGESSVVVANGDGEIVAMSDFKRRYVLDPNDRRGIARIADSLYMYGSMGSSVARSYFGNRNLMAITDGPGSSQKPLVWTAVAAGVNYEWDKFRINPYNGRIAAEVYQGNNVFRIDTFNCIPFIASVPFRPLQSDERGGIGVSLHDYMTYSSNVYNAVMAYIGSFSADKFNSSFLKRADTHDGSTLFSYPEKRSSYRRQFPYLSSSDGKSFVFNKQLVAGDIPRSVLHDNLQALFGIDKRPSDLCLLSDSIVPDPLSHCSEYYAYLEPSYLDSEARSQQKDGYLKGKFLLEAAIRSTAIGARRVWDVTPVKMAEAYGRMASLNTNYRLHIAKQAPTSYDCSIDLSDGYIKARPIQMKGLNDVMSAGTAKSLGNALGIKVDEDGSNRIGQYYVYAKTGTIGDGNRHRLGVIITNLDLAKTPVKDLPKLRYYVAYFTFSRAGHWNAYADVLRIVMSSVEFKKYMNNRYE